MSLKSWWNSLWEGNKDLEGKGIPKIPKVKQLKSEYGISEPVYTLAKLFLENPKRFHFKYSKDLGNFWSFVGGTTVRYMGAGSGAAYSSGRDSLELEVIDNLNGEIFNFHLSLGYASIEEMSKNSFYEHDFARHKIYPILDCQVTGNPNWITVQEREYLHGIVTDYFHSRVNRYIDIINYRKDRKKRGDERKSQIDKQKERQRLNRVYKGE